MSVPAYHCGNRVGVRGKVYRYRTVVPVGIPIFTLVDPNSRSASIMPPRIAVVGGGVASCSLVFALREYLDASKLSLTIFEMGRGPGGRAATRRTRERPALRVDHGAPAFEAMTPRFGKLCAALEDSKILKRCGPMYAGTLKSNGLFQMEDAEGAPARYTCADGRDMSALCDALLRGGSDPAMAAPALADTRYNTMVGKVEKTNEGAWRLSSSQGESLGDFDWLIVSSTGIAHPRWRSTFGGEPPLVAAAATIGDRALDAALASLAPLESKPVTACLLAFEGEAAAAWAKMPFSKLSVEGDATLATVSVQRLGPALTAVVLHSSHEFSRASETVYGATSTAARLAGAKTDGATEERLLATLTQAAEASLTRAFGTAANFRTPAWGPHLHRWGAAFPDAPLLAAEHAIVLSARVAFCGDYVDGGDGRAASVEGAALSGLQTADALVAALGVGDSDRCDGGRCAVL